MRRRTLIAAKRAEEVRSRLKRQGHNQLAAVIERNIDIIEMMRKEADNARSRQDRVADRITAWSGSLAFLYAHMAWFVIWIVINLGAIPSVLPFDPFPFGLLTMVVSLEAIFLSTIVLISQNRQSIQGEHREALDLQIDLLAEYEITRMLRLVDKIAEKMGIEDAYDAEIDELCEPVAPEVVLREIEKRHGS